MLAAAFPNVGIGLTGVSLAFGLTVLMGAYALGPISGGHFNPAVSVGLWSGGRFPGSQLLPFVIAQVVGAVVAAGVLYLIASGKADFSLAGGFASNGYGGAFAGKVFAHRGADHRGSDDIHVPGDHPRSDSSTSACRIRGPDDRPRADVDPSDQHSSDQSSVNPARSTGPALFVGGWALEQLWLFWLAPVIGAVIAGFVYKAVLEGPRTEPPVTGRA